MGLWWRAYVEALNDPKLQQLPDPLFRIWFNLLCVTSEHGGVLPDENTVAFKLRATIEKTERYLAELEKRGLLDRDANGNLAPHNWAVRQYKTDVLDRTNAERQRRYRQRHSVTADTVTGGVTSKRPESETEQSQIPEPEQKCSEAYASARMDVVDEDPKAKLFRIGKTTLVSFGVSENRAGSLIGHWLKALPDPCGILAALEFARDQNVAEPVAYVSALIHGKQQQGGMNEDDRRPGESLSAFSKRLAQKARQFEVARYNQRGATDPV